MWVGSGSDLVEKPDGSILLAGSFISKGPLHRFTADGKLDTSFQTEFGQFGEISQIVLQADGKMIVASPYDPGVIWRLNADGSFDQTFRAERAGGRDGRIALTANGGLLVGGNFQTFNGAPQANLVRLRTGEYSG